MNEVRYPEMREELIHELSSIVTSIRESDEICDEIAVDFDYLVHFLFDDTKLAEDSSLLIGWILRDTDEAMAITLVVSSMNDFFSVKGVSSDIPEYFSGTHWLELIEKIKFCLSVLQRERS